MSIQKRAVPELASLAPRPPAGPGWTYEYKYDGYRILAEVTGGRARLFTRNGNDFTEPFQVLSAPLSKLPHQPLILDGEVVAENKQGKASFQQLQRLFKQKAPISLRYMIFDVLVFEGHELKMLPLVERRKHLGLILQRPSRLLARPPVLKGEGEQLLREACAKGFEGIIAKKLSAPYRSGRTKDWLKCKCENREEFLVLGFTPHSKVPGQVGALLLGLKVAKGIFVLCGKVGTGFNSDERTGLYERLRAMRQDLRLLNPELLPRAAALVRPTLVAEIQFTEWTADGQLRQPSFQGLRTDKRPSEVTLTGSSHPARGLKA